jgi:hypothetical protein
MGLERGPGTGGFADGGVLLRDGVGGGVEEGDGADVSWLGVGCQLGQESDREEGGKAREKLEMASREGKGMDLWC